MCSRHRATCGNHKHADHEASASEPNPRLILAVVAAGVIIGALLSPSRQSDASLASNPPTSVSTSASR